METDDKVHYHAFEIWLFFHLKPSQDKLKARSTSHTEKYFWLNVSLDIPGEVRTKPNVPIDQICEIKTSCSNVS